jgi:alginate O-acetyltransferase complex protein AlgF
MKKFLALLALALCLGGPALAAGNADSGLYDPVPPEGSAFVRFVNVHPASGSREVKLDGRTVEYLDFQEISSYFVTPGKKTPTSVGAARGELDFAPGKFYTVALRDNGRLQIYEDPASGNLAKSQIIFYNFSPQKDLSLKTSDGKVEVIPAATADTPGVKLINPVKVSLAVYDGGQVLRDLGPVSMERARAYSVLVYPDHDVKWATGSTNTTR